MTGFRVVTGMFMHETNSFARVLTDVAAFERMICCRSMDEARDHLRHTNTEVAGYMDMAEHYEWDLHFTVAAAANPLGLVTDECFEHFTGLILGGIETAGHLDGVALALHGAMVSESHEDAELELVRRIRAIVGDDVPICTTLDLHANISPEFAGLVNIVCSYLTYPHIDMRTRAQRAGALLQRAMTGEIDPRIVYSRRPMLQGADGGRTDVEPMIGLQKTARDMRAADARVLDVSINSGFSQSDIHDVGPSVLLTVDGEDPQFSTLAESLMDRIWEERASEENHYYKVDEAAEIARSFNYKGRPLVIADYADNPGAGAYGDSTNLLRAMLSANLENACFGALFDPDAASRLASSAPGTRMTMELGGKTDPDFGGPPLHLEGQVVATTNGDMVFDGPVLAGIAESFGPTAVFRVAGVDILVVSNLMQIIDLQQFLAHGIDPRLKRTVALKSMQHFRATYEPIADRVIVCDSGGLATPDLTRFAYHNVRRPLYPLDSFDETPLH